MRELLDLFKKIIQVLRHFEGEFSERMRERAKVLLVGANLSPGRRMVTEALRLMGLHNEPQFQDVLATWHIRSEKSMDFTNGCAKLSRRLARYYLAIALFQPPLSE